MSETSRIPAPQLDEQVAPTAPSNVDAMQRFVKIQKIVRNVTIGAVVATAAVVAYKFVQPTQAEDETVTDESTTE